MRSQDDVPRCLYASRPCLFSRIIERILLSFPHNTKHRSRSWLISRAYVVPLMDELIPEGWLATRYRNLALLEASWLDPPPRGLFNGWYLSLRKAPNMAQFIFIIMFFCSMSDFLTFGSFVFTPFVAMGNLKSLSLIEARNPRFWEQEAFIAELVWGGIERDLCDLASWWGLTLPEFWLSGMPAFWVSKSYADTHGWECF